MVRSRIRRLTATLRTRAAFGLGPATSPSILLLPMGVLLGPAGTGVIGDRALAHLDAVVSIALATLGVFIGIALGSQRWASRRFVLASAAEGVTTSLIVGLATYALIVAWGLPLDLSGALTAAALAVAASASAAPFVGDIDTPARITAARVADMDDVVPLVVGGVVLGLISSNPGGLTRDLLITLAAGAGVGATGWLLLDGAEGAERGVLVLGMLALLGGCAAYTDTSALLAGIVSGFLWAHMPGETDRIAAEDLRKVQHPLVVLLLVVAGAALTPTLAGVWLFGAYVLFRLSGKFAGAWIASRVAPAVAAGELGGHLIAPGVIGIAFVLNVQQVTPEAAAPIVFAVAAGAVASDVLALLLAPAPTT